MYSPTLDRTDSTLIARDERKMMAALKSAYALDPDNTTIADWLGEELDQRQQYTAALEVYLHSTNAQKYQRIGEMYETGKGIAIDLPMAISWYKRSAKAQITTDSSLKVPYYYDSESVRHLYRLICQRKISSAAVSPYFKRSEYQRFFQDSLVYQRNNNLKTNPCVLGSGG